MDRSLWIDCKKQKRYPMLEENKQVDICIIGAGLTGITLAYYLVKAGKSVTILEKNEICSHTSGNTTAKITSQHGLIYNYLLQSVGKKEAKQYLDSNEQAINNIKQIVQDEKIDCDFEKQDAYIFTQKQDEIQKLKKEKEALEYLDLDCEFLEKIPLSTKCNDESNKEQVNENKISIKKKILGAIRFKNQAQFNPVLYAEGLSNTITKNGGEIYENSKVIDIKKESENYKVITEKGELKCKVLVIASHYPIVNSPGFYFMKMYQETSYLIAIETKEKLFEGMYISSEDPTISFRVAKYKNKDVLLVGGMKHKTGAKINLENSYEILEKVAKQLYPDAKVIFRWNTEDCISLDKIPYIGEFSNLWPNVYVATGYKKWGMTTSNVAANIIRDKILGKKNLYEDVYKSTRLKPVKNYEELGNMIKEVSYSGVINKLKKEENTMEDVKRGEGKIIEIDGKKVGAYRDNEGKVYAVKPYCTHLGCELSWNDLDNTWDCPCHGSKFDYTGKNIYDPAIKDLERLE